MKRFFIVSGLGIAVILLLLTSLKAQDQKKQDQKKEETQQEGVVVYSFKDDQDLQQFQQLLQARQIVNTRMAVLQAYLTQEAGNLQQVNGQLSLNYKIDPSKNYRIDSEKKVIRQVSAPATPAITSVTETTKP